MGRGKASLIAFWKARRRSGWRFTTCAGQHPVIFIFFCCKPCIRPPSSRLKLDALDELDLNLHLSSYFLGLFVDTVSEMRNENV